MSEKIVHHNFSKFRFVMILVANTVALAVTFACRELLGEIFSLIIASMVGFAAGFSSRLNFKKRLVYGGVLLFLPAVILILEIQRVLRWRAETLNFQTQNLNWYGLIEPFIALGLVLAASTYLGVWIRKIANKHVNI